MKPAPHTLRVLARLLSYPNAELREHLAAMRDAVRAEAALSRSRMAEIEQLIATLGGGDPLDVEAEYVHLFDRGRSTSLHLFEHVHGDSRERGPAMIDLAQTYEKAGLYLTEGELPDHLTVVLEFVSTQPVAEAQGFLAEMSHILNAIFAALQQRKTPYASVLGALLDLAGEKAQPVRLQPEPPLDESWAEPVAFDGCSSAGQAKPGQPQPIHLVRKDATRAGATP